MTWEWQASRKTNTILLHVFLSEGYVFKKVIAVEICKIWSVGFFRSATENYN
jgi:hypothetical protein